MRARRPKRSKSIRLQRRKRSKPRLQDVRELTRIAAPSEPVYKVVATR
jgi:hypothetical protein